MIGLSKLDIYLSHNNTMQNDGLLNERIIDKKQDKNMLFKIIGMYDIEFFE